MDIEVGDDVITHVDDDSIKPICSVGRTSKRWSKVWDEFIIILGQNTKDGKDRAQCKHCKVNSFLYASHNGTSSAKKHLDKCEPYKNRDLKEGNAFDQKAYRDLVARAIIKHGYAFSWVEHEGNRRIHTYLNNKVHTICRNTAKSDCLKLHTSLKGHLKATLKDLPGRICLTADMWTSCQTEGYLCLTAHFVDSNWKLNSRVLNFCHLEPPHSGHNMYNIVYKRLQDWGIDKKIFSITLDNASSNDKMQTYLKTMLDGQDGLLRHGDYFHIRCAAHVLNLIVQVGLNVIKNCLVKVRESVKFVKASEARKISFRSCVQSANISETKALWLDVPTRWNSTYMMIDRVLLYRGAFAQLNVQEPLYKTFPEKEEWEKLEKIHDILEPFCNITELFSGSDYPTANLYFENVWKINMILKELVEGEDEDLKNMAKVMKGKFDEYWVVNPEEDDYCTLFAFAVLLDPRCKLPFLTYCFEKLHQNARVAHEKVSDVRFKLGMLLTEYTPSTTSNTNSNTNNLKMNQSGSRKRKFDFLADFRKDNSSSGGYAFAKTKLDIYLEDDIMDQESEFNILEFWKQHEQRYGELSYLARDVLTVPLTTVASESTFSIGGRILNKWRSCYIPENVEALITTRSWLYGYESTEDDEFTGSFVEWGSTTPQAC